jgi:hypothetical protein
MNGQAVWHMLPMEDVMKDLLSTIMACVMVFAFGYISGCDAERDEHAQAEKAMQHRVEVLNDLLKKRAAELEAKTNAKTQVIRATPDTSGCADAYAPTVIIDSVR